MFNIYFDYCKYLSGIGVSSGSAFVIHLSTFGTLLITVFAHLLFMIPYLLTRNPIKEKMFHKIMKTIFNYITFGVYIRLFLEIFFRYCLVAAKEIYDGNNKSSNELKISYYISVILLCIWSCFPLFVLFHWLSLWFYQFKVENSKFSELYAEIKQNLIARAYTLIFIIKRVVFIWLVTIFYSLPLLTKVAIFSWVNVLSYVHLVSCKPFEAVKDNIVEIIMDSFYLFISAFMWVYNTRGSWRDWWTAAVISCILLSYVATTIVNLIVAYFNLKKLICSWASRVKNLTKTKAVSNEESDISNSKLGPISKTLKRKLYEESKILNATSDLASNIQLAQDQNLVEIPFRLKPITLSEFDEVQDEDDIEEIKEKRINQDEPFFFDIENEINKNVIIQANNSQNEQVEQKNQWEEKMKQDMNKIKNRIKRKMHGIDIKFKTSD